MQYYFLNPSFLQSGTVHHVHRYEKEARIEIWDDFFMPSDAKKWYPDAEEYYMKTCSPMVCY